MTNNKNKINIKDINMDTATSLNEDTGFCSGEESNENEFHSSTESSEDSVEVKVSPITLVNTKKRSLGEDTKKPIAFTGPLKKRMCLKIKAEENGVISTPFRPWSKNCDNSNNSCNSSSSSSNSKIKKEVPILVDMPTFPKGLSPKDLAANTITTTTITTTTTVKRECLTPHNHIEKMNNVFSQLHSPSRSFGYGFVAAQQSEPVSLVIKREKIDSPSTKLNISNSNNNDSDIRVPPIHPGIMNLSTTETEHLISKTNEQFPSLQNTTKQIVNKTNSCSTIASDTTTTASTSGTQNLKKSDQKRENRNYKNMTRERRMEANARERTRVHTISAAFETLRVAIPSYSHNQKLSKLSILRIACSYIMTLSNLLDINDDSVQESSIPQCIEAVSNTIQKEGKLRKKKDDND